MVVSRCEVSRGCLHRFLILRWAEVLEDAGVSPLVDGGLDEAFRLAVGAWSVGPGSAMLQAKPNADAGEVAGFI
jgi:hypothetical protein